MERPREKIDTSVLTEGVKDISLMKEWGEYLGDGKNNMTTNQLRKFFGTVKKIQMDFNKYNHEIILLNPKLAYAVGRDKGKTKIKEFYDLISPLIENIGQDEKKFKNFVSVFEALVAYHKVKEEEKNNNND